MLARLQSACHVILAALCIWLLLLGPFLHAHMGSFRIGGFHLPGLAVVSVPEDTASVGTIVAPQPGDLLGCPNELTAISEQKLEWPESAVLGVGHSTLRERLTFTSLSESTALPVDALMNLSWLLIAWALIAVCSFSRRRFSFVCPPVLTLHGLTPPAQAPPIAK